MYLIHKRKWIRIMAGVKKVPCRALFKKSNELPLASKFLHPFLLFIVDNVEMFQTYVDKHKAQT
jgi:hypothetical protein